MANVDPPSSQARSRRSRLPAYQRIARAVRERIANGSYVVGEYLPPERDLAAAHQASRETVRLAIDLLRTEGLLVAEQGRGTLIVGSGQPAEESRGDQFNLIALIIYGISRDGSAAMLQGCQSAAQHEDHHLIVCETSREDTRVRATNEAAHLNALLDKGVGGLIIYAEPTEQNHALLAEAVRRGVPVVQIDRYLPGLGCDYVGVDNRTAAAEMVEHLCAIGRRRIAFLSLSPEASTCRERAEGYRDVMSARGLPGRVAFCETSTPLDAELFRLVAGWREAGEVPDAVFAVNDALAVALLQALRDHGLRTPEDVGVVGFDGSDLSALITPPLTTVEQPFHSLGETAGQLLLDRMAGRYSGVPRRVLCPTRLVVRESCGASLGAGILRAVG